MRAIAATLGCLLYGAALCCSIARAQNPAVCGQLGPISPPTIAKPVVLGGVTMPTDANFDCMMWQNFVYLNWPAKSGVRGVPNPNASFGAPGQTVWETFKTVDQTFLANGANPGPWDAPSSMPAGLKSALRRDYAAGKIRVLQQRSKVSRRLQTDPPPTLSEDVQVGGGTLVDQAGQVVYYEVLLNQQEYQYITSYDLFEATAQYRYASTTGISLPVGSISAGTPGAIEIKAAWKVLTQAEQSASPVRFHTSRAILGNSGTPVTVGLVGLHIIQRAENVDQFVWSTFSQIDNAPPSGATPTSGFFSFYKIGCAPCVPNQQTTPPVPTQVVQTVSSRSDAIRINAFMQQQIAAADANSPWQFYRLVDVQWPTAAVPLPSPPVPIKSGLPSQGSPNINLLLNPVLETFLQSQTNLSCLGCHQGAASANPSKLDAYPSSYSFVFAHANAAPSSSSKRAISTLKKSLK